jgi:hypothetical protein
MTFEYKGAHPRVGSRWWHFFKRTHSIWVTEEDTPIVAEFRASVADEAGRNGEMVVDPEQENPA